MLRDPALIPLSHQHHNGLAMCVLLRRSLASDSSPANLAKLARLVADRYELELVNHFAIEEQALFPACGRLAIVDELVADHRSLEALVAKMQAAPTSDLLERFCTLLTAHIRREEGVLFEHIQQALPREELDRLGGEINRRAVRICLSPEPFTSSPAG